MIRTWSLMAVIIAMLIGCSRDTENSQTNIPNNVTYSIINSDIVPVVKRSLEVRLNMEVSEETIRAIALKLKAEDSRTYERTFITYYLPDMKVGAGAWATSHFNPDLEVRILGLSVEEKKELTATDPLPQDREIIGRWLDESTFGDGLITIYREQGKLFSERKFKDGSILKEELIEKKSSKGRRFDRAKETRSGGDHWVIIPNGDLQFYDNDGLWKTVKKK
ncbi:MAG: hypothetical protein WCC06_12145 [Candidatus Aminicenantales bacterium]